MTGAYAGILNGGSSVVPYGLKELRLQGDFTPLAGRSGGVGERVINENSAKALVFMMYQVVQKGTGRRAKIDGVERAGKTGTTQSSRDAWFIGFTSDFIIGVWVGNDDNTPLIGVTGGTIPADIWRETMANIIDQSYPLPLAMNRGQSRNPRSLEPLDQSKKSLSKKTILNTIWEVLIGEN